VTHINLSGEKVPDVPFPKRFPSKPASKKAAVDKKAKLGCCYCGKVHPQSSHSQGSGAP
jgi:hypothetical protein